MLYTLYSPSCRLPYNPYCLLFRIAFYLMSHLLLAFHSLLLSSPLAFYSLLPFIPLALYSLYLPSSIFPTCLFLLAFHSLLPSSLCGIESSSFGYSLAMSDQEKLVMKALFKAVRSQDLDKIQRLALQEGFDVNAADEVSLQ